MEQNGCKMGQNGGKMGKKMGLGLHKMVLCCQIVDHSDKLAVNSCLLPSLLMQNFQEPY